MANIGTIKYNNGSSWIDILHPVNSFYFSFDNTSPSELFGGTWTQILGAVRGIDDLENTGYVGADTHSLTIDEMPRHTHSANLNYAINNTIPTNMGFSFNDTGGLYRERIITDNLGEYGTLGILNNMWGGKHTVSCNALLIVLSGIGQLRILTSFGGEIYV